MSSTEDKNELLGPRRLCSTVEWLCTPCPGATPCQQPRCPTNYPFSVDSVHGLRDKWNVRFVVSYLGLYYKNGFKLQSMDRLFKIWIL